jgi:hypothetical protein
MVTSAGEFFVGPAADFSHLQTLTSALMAIPTMTATLLLSGKVTAAASDYFKRLK